MQIGIHLPHHRAMATPQAIASVARRAEELGYDSVWVSDHVLLPNTPGEAHRFNFYDPLTVLPYVAALTSRVRLGTTVMILPYRNPIVLAKSLATLDQLSGGRLIFGAAGGSVPGEFRALGVSWEERGAISDEYLAVIRGLWTEEDPRFEGRYCRYRDVRFEPKPLQRPHPPIWVGGNSRPALRRVARYGDVWHASGLFPEQIQERLPYLCEQAGRNVPVTLRTNVRILTSPNPALRDAPGPHGQPVPLRGDPTEIAEQLSQYAAIGLEHVVLDLNVSTPEAYLDVVEALAERVLVVR